MKWICSLLFAFILIAAMSGNVLAQGVITFGGDVPAVCWLTNTGNGSLAGVLGNFGTLVVGKNVLASPTPLAFRIRSNAPYKLTVRVDSLVGIGDAAGSTPGTTARAINTGDIGFGITAIDVSLSRLVGGGTTPIREDAITTGFDVRAGWPSPRGGHTPNFAKTLHDIYGNDTQLLSGPRVSADGDNNSNNNFMTVFVGLSTLPQFLTATDFSGVVTFTVAPSGS